jgi:hypothetical protein
MRSRVVRITGIPFVIVGPVMIVIGIISISHGRITVSGVSALPSPFRYLFIAVTLTRAAWCFQRPGQVGDLGGGITRGGLGGGHGAASVRPSAVS